ncbi:hypothetical protein [Alkalimarinus coralli]|uniref:hypothetical protein n=1 Tax=Alkalimarinus coralli TaxID=2935863 RepID=UPI00202B513B|nr:hypothetical protein [Alkalimarinus coralli]
MKNKLLKACGGVMLVLMVLASASCVWYRDGFHSIIIVNHTDRPIFTSSIQLGGFTYWAGAANAQNEGGSVLLDVKWVPRKAIFTWNWGDVIGDEDNVQVIPIPPYPDLPSGARVRDNQLRIHVFPNDRIIAELGVSYIDKNNDSQGVSFYDGPKKIGWWWHRH